jgi:predicted nucleic acid-binding protein
VIDAEAVIDASVVVPLASRPDGIGPIIVRLGGVRLRAPQFLLVESANAFWKSVRAGLYDAATAQAHLNIVARMPIVLHEDQSVLSPALHLATTLRHPVYDCLYLALAVELDCALLTADKRLAAAAAPHADLAARVRVLPV